MMMMVVVVVMAGNGNEFRCSLIAHSPHDDDDDKPDDFFFFIFFIHHHIAIQFILMMMMMMKIVVQLPMAIAYNGCIIVINNNIDIWSKARLEKKKKRNNDEGKLKIIIRLSGHYHLQVFFLFSSSSLSIISLPYSEIQWIMMMMIVER